ncbi:flagellar assembly protein [Candidatus Photodesmus katoptron]|uniref:Flagellar assembly protein FliH n=1 Tax=Candidatus Photodesmus katoptron Akat1 TaxID=1236703 RepID=S3DHJ5_9GAMM|nr:flagellar assembly protein FliH [Candidatus Photodesmus katoptron]EPE37902.1 flagellar assembly protein FliH [Candidatus Photodesmus katoptron Akat1]KEY90377.1 flagellar assembly protein [Candidatus Photodesmus katoptron]
MVNKKKQGYFHFNQNKNTAQAKRWVLVNYPEITDKKTHKNTAMNYHPNLLTNISTNKKEKQYIVNKKNNELLKKEAYKKSLLKGHEDGFKKGYDTGQQKGIKEGQKQGFESGKVEGIKEGEKIIQKQVDILVKLANQFSEPLEELQSKIVKQLVDMVLILVKEIVHIEVKTNPKIILDTVKQSIKALPILETSIIIKLHPDDLAIIQSVYNKKELDQNNWILSPEPKLNRGDIQMKTNESSVSYKIKDRIEDVIHNFKISNHQL